LQLGFPKPFSSKRLPAWVLGIPLKKNGDALDGSKRLDKQYQLFWIIWG